METYKDLIQRRLLQWYETEKRDLPWREQNPDPYRVWVSEVMLQQTRVEAAIPYYEQFIRRFPTLEDLAAAEESDVLKSWEGLGYYSRARNLHQGVREVCEQYAGRVPDTTEEILRIRGIGSYTAGAILSIAYGQAVPAVDGNVMRVISRLFHVQEDIARSTTKKSIESLVQHLIPEEDSASFNQALMELGALVCTPRSPGCLMCPLREVCEGYAAGYPERLPVKSKKKPAREVALGVGVLWKGEKVLIQQRPPEGLLANLWEFPHFEWEAAEIRWRDLDKTQKIAFLEDRFDRKYGLQVRVVGYLMPIRHAFTHLRWEGDAFVFVVESEEAAKEFPHGGRWVSPQRLRQFAFPVAYGKMVQRIVAGNQPEQEGDLRN